MNRGTSPRHARNVTLVLSLDTGLVFPQYNVHFDDVFQTVGQQSTYAAATSHWQVKSGFKTQNKMKSPTYGQSVPRIRSIVDKGGALLIKEPILHLGQIRLL